MSWVVVVCAACVLPAHPIRAIRAVLSFPNRDLFFDAVDEEATGAKSLGAMGRRSGANDGHLAHFERTHAVKSRHTHSGDLSLKLLPDVTHLLFGHRRVGMVLEPRHG